MSVVSCLCARRFVLVWRLVCSNEDLLHFSPLDVSKTFLKQNSCVMKLLLFFFYGGVWKERRESSGFAGAESAVTLFLVAFGVSLCVAVLVLLVFLCHF